MSFKRRVLSALGKEPLLEIGRSLELEVAARMTVDELRDALASSKRATLESIVSETLSRDGLKHICEALGLDSAGREKAVLVERILAARPGVTPPTTYAIPATASKGSKASERGATGLLPGFGAASAPTKTKEKPAPKERRRRGGVTDADAAVAGTLKAALQQFALGAAGGYTGRDAHLNFSTHLLECFGWKDGHPEGAELPARFSVADSGQRVEREVALWWSERNVLMDVAPHDAVLDFAWKELLRVCLQLDKVPQYVVLTNQRDLHLYDLARDREAPRLAIRIDDLAKYSEAFPFFTKEWKPGAIPKIVNVEKVSEEVAELVARLYRSVRAQHPERERDVIRFTLQCITAMFAEDIGLLPKNYFTSLLYNGAKSGDVERRLRELFTQMNTPNLPAPRVVPYFNGGLFVEATTLPLGDSQLSALTKAAEANWTFVDPHIFGSVFQGIMDDAERHKSGAHYTAFEDIMRVVGPTIVEPWRRRIVAASSLKELSELRRELFAYRVLDPACGSGNFLYVAFRELYRLDTELLSRMREFPTTAAKLSWNGGISAANFFGIDINPFAVELAKVTLNIAKKIAFEERREQAFALAGQVEMDIDPSLPLDNLDKNIVCSDALFTPWPAADAIVSNPPFLGAQKLRRELGVSYMQRLQEETGQEELVDLVCYFFRRTHDHLPKGARAGLVATSGVRVGAARKASLDYLVAQGGTITNAVSSHTWPGDAAVNVSMVNWVKGPASGPFTLLVDDQIFSLPHIATHLQLHSDTSDARDIRVNGDQSPQGVSFGHPAFRGGESGFGFGGFGVRPRAGADDMLRGKLTTDPEECIYLPAASEQEARAANPRAYQYLHEQVFPLVKGRAESGTETGHYKAWLRRWWMPQQAREGFISALQSMRRVLVCPRVMARPVFAFLSTTFIPDNTLILFAFDDDYTFGVMQSRFHWDWVKAQGSKVRSDIQYTTLGWRTFPWPQEPSEEHVARVAAAGRELRSVRDSLMRDNGWSLRQLHQAAKVDGHHPLKDAQGTLDSAVADAYGAPADQSPTEFLLELNQLIVEDEARGLTVRGPGLPDNVKRGDARWLSTDCIEPPTRS